MLALHTPKGYVYPWLRTTGLARSFDPTEEIFLFGLFPYSHIRTAVVALQMLAAQHTLIHKVLFLVELMPFVYLK